MPANKNVSTSSIALTLLGGFLLACAGPRMQDKSAPPAAPGGDMSAPEAASEGRSVLENDSPEPDSASGEGQAVRDAGSVKQERGDTDTDTVALDPEAAFAEYEQQLALREQQLRGAGITLAHLSDATAPLAKNPDSVPPGQPTQQGGNRTTKTRKKPKKKKTSANKPTTKASATGGVTSMCVQICTLSQATCELEHKICNLAARHSDSERYATVCQRAREDCSLATQACKKCG